MFALLLAAALPNIIVVTTDDQRADAVGYASESFYKTPGLDRLADRSLVFTDAHAAFALCSPSRAAILTGQYGSRNGVNGLGGGLNRPASSVAHALKRAGYSTAVSGKWHLANKPKALGFDWSVTFQANGSWYGRKVNQNGKAVKPEKLVDLYCSEQSAEFLRTVEKDKPFFLWHCTQLPHMDHRHSWPASDESLALFKWKDMPLPPSWDDQGKGKPPHLMDIRNRTQALKYGYNRGEPIRKHIRDYAATMRDLDQALQPLWTEMDKLGLWENTLVIFLSDNGWMLGEHGLTSKVLPYAPSARIPMMVTGPGINPGSSDALVSNLDIAPTLLSLAGVPVPAEVEGMDLAALWNENGGEWRTSFIYEGTGGYGGVPPTGAVITRQHQLIASGVESPVSEGAFYELYDRQADPDERNNLAPTAPASVISPLRNSLKGHPWDIEQ